MRRVDACMNCGENRELAAHGLCFNCYRKRERTIRREAEGIVDRHTPGIRREQKRLLKAYTMIMTALGDIGVSSADVTKVQELLGPYLSMVDRFVVIGKTGTEG